MSEHQSEAAPAWPNAMNERSSQPAITGALPKGAAR
jgi:hypothetical protein